MLGHEQQDHKQAVHPVYVIVLDSVFTVPSRSESGSASTGAKSCRLMQHVDMMLWLTDYRYCTYCEQLSSIL